MSTRTWTHALAVTALVGCGPEMATPDQAAVAQMESPPLPPLTQLDGDLGPYVVRDRCPESTTNCTGTNGPGIYAEEGGRAGMDVDEQADKFSLLITSFVNGGSRVAFRARYLDELSPVTPPPWQWVTGTVDSADYNGAPGHRVAWVTEQHNRVIWTLVTPTNTLREVIDTDLGNLRLHISVPQKGAPSKQLTLYFTDATPAYFTGARITDAQSYRMRWSFDGAPPPRSPRDAMPYCLGVHGDPDRVVFQRAITVDPINGTVQHDRDDTPPLNVTVSCTLGAIATAYLWGYPYVTGPDDTPYFESAIHMKRASYCADAHAYTIADTHIAIHDDQSIQNDPVTFLEAWWSPAGAICVNPDNRRHRGMNGGTCAKGTHKPPCPLPPERPPGSPPGPYYLISGASPPAD